MQDDCLGLNVDTLCMSLKQSGTLAMTLRLTMLNDTLCNLSCMHGHTLECGGIAQNLTNHEYKVLVRELFGTLSV